MSSSRNGTGRRLGAGIIAAVVLAASAFLAGCAPSASGEGLSESGEPLTVAQSESLASARFQLAAKGPFALSLRSGTADDVAHLSASLTVDPGEHRAWGAVFLGPEQIAAAENVAFSPDTYAILDNGRWNAQPIGAAPNQAMLLLFSLGSDRPENAQLLRQSDTRYLGTTTLDGRTVDVYRLVSNSGAVTSTRLWLDEKGGLRRLDAGDDERFVITVLDDEPAEEPAGLDTVLEDTGSGAGG